MAFGVWHTRFWYIYALGICMTCSCLCSWAFLKVNLIMANYLTLKQATETTGKSQRQLRRLCNDPENKDFVTHDDKGRLLVDANFLAQNYPLVNVPIVGKNVGVSMPKDANGANGINLHSIENLTIKVAQLEQELRHKEELSTAIIAEKIKVIEVLERSLMMLGEARPVIAPQAPAEPEPAKRKKFLGLF